MRCLTIIFILGSRWHPQAARNVFSRLAASVCLLLPVAIFLTASPVRAQTVLLTPLEREMTGSDVHSYRLLLKPDQFIRAVFDQRGIDVVVKLLGTNGETLLEVDNPVGAWGPEPLFFEVVRGGYYTIEVRPRKPSARGRYGVGIEARHARANDLRRFPAERAFAQATQFLLDKSAPSLPKATAKYEEAHRLFQLIADRRGEITTLNTLGAVTAALGGGQQALRYFNEALPLLRATADRAGEATTLGNIALVYHSLGDRARALEYLGQSFAIFREEGDQRMAAYALNNIGLVHDSMGEDEQALENFNRSLPLFRAANDRRGEAVTLNNIGLAYDSIGEKRRARQSYEQALDVFSQSGDCGEIGPVLSNIALKYLEDGDRQKALDYLDQALVAQRQIRDREGEAKTLNNIGFIYNTQGNRRKALEYYNQSLAIHHEVGNRRGEGDTFSNLMFAWTTTNPPLSIFYGKQAITAYQEVRSTLSPLDKDAQKTFVESTGSAYRQLADLLISKGRLPEAQQVLDMLKEDEYVEFVRRDAGEAAAHKSPATLTPAETELDKRYRQIADRVAAIGAERGALRAKQTLTPEEEQRLSKLDADLEVAGQSFQQFLDNLGGELGSTSEQPGGKVYELREAQGLMVTLGELGGHAVALYTVVGENKYSIILTTPDAQKAAEYPIKAVDLYAKIAAFREVLQNPRRDPRPLAQELYRILVGPIAKDLKEAQAETLMWSLDGALRYIPVAALHDGQGYLVERYRNVVFTPASRDRLKDLPSATWKGVAFGVSKPQVGFSALPAVPEELRSIINEGATQTAESAGVLLGKILLDESFTGEAMKTSLRQRYSVVHIASHFAFQPGNETDSFLLLGDGSHLTLAQIKASNNLFSGVELLTLSACNTATTGENADGKEVEGFGVLAQRQGAKAVMASLWPVADASTRRLMQSFYRQRNAQPGTLKVEALRQAQLSLLRGDGKELSGNEKERGLTLSGGSGQEKAGSASAQPRFQYVAGAPYSHPYFWAPFIMIGNWR